MQAIGDNGIYISDSKGKLNIVRNINTNLLTDEDIKIHDLITEYLVHGNENSIYELADRLKEYITDSDITISLNAILGSFIELSNVESNRYGVTINFSKSDLSTIKEKVISVVDRLNMIFFAINGLRTSKQGSSKIVQNFVLNTIIDIYNDPRSLMGANNPTTMDPVNNVVKEENLEKALRPHLDPSSIIFLNQTTSVGKTDIGITAIAQKAFYALTYYNDLKYRNNESVFNPKIINIPMELTLHESERQEYLKLPNNPFKTHTYFSLGFEGSKINQATIDDLKNWIISLRDADIVENQNGTYYNPKNTNLWFYIDNEGYVYYGNSNYKYANNSHPLISELKLVQLNRRIGRFIPTTINSACISSSTDNTKEMKMDLLNATPEVVPAYEYCLSIGINIKEASRILTHPAVQLLIAKTKGNLFKDELPKSRISKVLKSLGNKDNFNAFKAELALYYPNEPFTDDLYNLLLTLFNGGEEISTLGRTLSINGGIQVLTGAPLLYQLNFEKNFNEIIDNINKGHKEDKNWVDIPHFSLKDFVSNEEYANRYSDLIEQNKESYNILAIMKRVPHFYSFIKVPIQYRYIMESLSSDIQRAYRVIDDDLKYHSLVDEDLIKKVLRCYNDNKTYMYLKSINFNYTPSQYYRTKENNSLELIDNLDNTELSTNSITGMINLKYYIETTIIPKMYELFNNNTFMDNLIYNSQYNILFQQRVGSYSSKLNLNDKQFTEKLSFIKSDFYQIQDVNIEGHTVGEWMFIYDLLTKQHVISRNSFSVVFDNIIDLNDPNNIVYKWTKFINDYDSINFIGDTKIQELSDIKLNTFNKTSDEMEGMLPDEIETYKSSLPSWAINPNIFPLFVNTRIWDNQDLLSRNDLIQLYNNGLITIFIC